MSIKYLSLFVLCCLVGAVSCRQDESTYIDLSELGVVELLGDGSMAEVAVHSNAQWSAASDAAWCVVERTASGIRIAADPYIGTEVRHAVVRIEAEGTAKLLPVRQKATLDYQFKLPTVVHVLYSEEGNTGQNLPTGLVYEYIRRVNRCFSRLGVGVELVPAEQSPTGKPLAEPGIDRIPWKYQYPIVGDDFPSLPSSKLYGWNINKYLNVYFFWFAGNTGVAGFSVFPFVSDLYPLAGLDAVPHTHLEPSDFDGLRGLFINSQYANSDTTEMVLTLVHELGHYLGLYHTFGEPDDPSVCADTDYCTDTKTYNRLAYEDYLTDIANNHPGDFTIENVYFRTSCSGERFKADNIMDYFYGNLHQFTPQQVQRIRHVLNYGLGIAGPKGYDLTASRSADRPQKPLKGRYVE